MLKILLKKQFAEIASGFSVNRKTGKKRKKPAIIGYALLYLFLIVVFAFIFKNFAMLLAPAFSALELGWMYFVIMGAVAFVIGVFGSVFNTYSEIYKAKDNEMLLSLPIKPSNILGVRILSVSFFAALFAAIVYIPTLIEYYINFEQTSFTVINSVISFFVIVVFIVCIDCLLAWIIAVISSKLKNKTVFTVIFTLAFMVIYYFFIGSYYEYAMKIISKAVILGKSIRGNAYPLYVFGAASVGNPIYMAILIVLAASIFTLLYFVLSKTFISVVTVKTSVSIKKFNDTSIKVSGIEKALLKKEFKHYSSSVLYILNCSLGTIFMPVASVAVIFMKNKITKLLLQFNLPKGFLPVLVISAVCLISSMNDICAPSISLEGKNLWIIKSLPVDAIKIFNAKQKLHWLLTMPPAAVFAVCLGFVLDISFSDIIFCIMTSLLYIMLFSAGELLMNLYFPNFNWTNEAIPIKQSLSVSVAIFGGMILSVLIGVGGYFLLKFINPSSFLTVLLIAFAIAVRLLNTALQKKGRELFETL